MNRTLIHGLLAGAVLTGQAAAATLTVDAKDASRFIITTWQADIELLPGADDRVRVDYTCEGPEPAAPAAEGWRSVASTPVPQLSRNDEKILLKAPEIVGSCTLSIAAPPALKPEIRVNARGVGGRQELARGRDLLGC